MSDKIISTKCPMLNDVPFNQHTLEVLVLFLGNKPSNVICPKYSPEECEVNKGHACLYKEGWKSFSK